MKSESCKPGKMKIMSPDKSELMEISSIYQDAGNLVISGKIMGSLPMKAVIRPQDARNGLRLLNLKLILFLTTFLFRR
ncbi:hypothetical protein [Sphingobium phenoxybenzoativorans]|uniref:hypothetical protein n=1 Tax=Sphingobium phenoxybenzoativorans TaxID=1592790 RepID=UPI00209A67F6|nr:hypothetical protein [Sphingobium phenoxybenzoativorans]